METISPFYSIPGSYDDSRKYQNNLDHFPFYPAHIPHGSQRQKAPQFPPCSLALGLPQGGLARQPAHPAPNRVAHHPSTVTPVCAPSSRSLPDAQPHSSWPPLQLTNSANHSLQHVSWAYFPVLNA